MAEDWQDNRTILECNRYMLDNQVACDVTFKVGRDDVTAELVGAHKYMLISRSPVFYDMFWGEGREETGGDPVRISEMKPQAFRDCVLRFIYCGTVELNENTLPDHLYASEVYGLAGLRNQCLAWMKENIRDDTACTIWVKAALYQSESHHLDIQARDYLLEHASDVIRTPGFAHLSQSSLKEVLSSDDLMAQEEDLYNACLEWAQHKCMVSQEEATGSAIRQALGDCLHLIRFPLMSGQSFVDLMQTSSPDVLTKDEENSLLRFYITGKTEEAQPLPFRKTPRKWKKISAPTSVVRYGAVRNEMWTVCDGNKDAICFTCDRAIVMKGVIVYGGNQAGSHRLQIDVQKDSGSVVYTRTVDVFKSPGTRDHVEFLFTKDVPIPAATKHAIVQRMWGRDVYRGLEGKTLVTSGDVTFTFMASPQSQNGTNVKYGLLPGILFQLSA